MIVRHLGHTDFNRIMSCFLSAFENYFVPMPTDYNYYKKRWEAAKVNFNWSYGMFDGDTLAGFIIHAIDERHGEHIAFNTGTGVIPEYRGQKIVKSIYEYAITDLIRHGITKSVLEVITKNEKAIKAYQGVGFNISKTFKCFTGNLSIDEAQITVKKVPFFDIDWNHIPNQDTYSWDFHSRCLEHGNSDYYYVYHEDKIESFFAINVENGTINQLEVLINQNENWKRLFQAVQSITKQVRIINVDHRLEEKLRAIEDVGLLNTVNQYEMELYLKS
ncbi:GNAT family N-acetyltransferase [Psychroserpens algicola]|uniref:GNAT family N-acetyltransferase n=1 Tax=Psychroserpens algicola TaxID=1719034 RepID=A0ABT0H9K6_9FLAO|nr:GNAT family N-acetyltransferase [Psychroserpens algicola]MCK8481053.1 GNAT family N-acetyltransferase [Psychroserpens algicola]